MLSLEEIDYCPSYCEENIWRLCQHDMFADTQTYILFISNPTKSCAMWNQRSATNSHYPVVWDYHVVLLAKTDRWRVFDLDSSLPLGIQLDAYLQQSFSPPVDANNAFGQSQSQVNVIAEYRPCFKLVCGKSYAQSFNSDRRHMFDQQGDWIAPPPVWPVIVGEQAMSLEYLIDMNCTEVLTLSTLETALVDLC